MISVSTVNAAAIIREFERAKARAAKLNLELRACCESPELFSLRDTTLSPEESAIQQVLLESLDQVFGYLKGFEVGQAKMQASQAAQHKKEKGAKA